MPKVLWKLIHKIIIWTAKRLPKIMKNVEFHVDALHKVSCRVHNLDSLNKKVDIDLDGIDYEINFATRKINIFIYSK